MRALYVSPMAYGGNSAVDTLSHALDHALDEAGIELFVGYADFREEGWIARTDELVREGVDGGIDAIVLWLVDAGEPAEAVAYARAEGVAVISLERPRFDVDASIVYPNFNHGVYMMEYLATLLPAGARVAVVGGPDVTDDIELMLGIVHGLSTSGLDRVNDPEDPRYKNTTDVRTGGKVATANLLADFASLDGLVPFNDETALGAIEALTEAGRLGEVKMVSRNGTPNLVALVRAGVHHGTWDIDIIGIGRAAASLVVRALVDKEDLDGLCIASPIGHIISPARAETWVPWEERMPYRSLRPWPPAR